MLMGQRNSVVFLFLLILAIFSCTGEKQKKDGLFTEEETSFIISQWKKDTLGCYNLRDDIKMNQLISQVGLIGQDSSQLVEYLGGPEHIFYTDEYKIYSYFLGCGKKGVPNYANFNCFMKQGKLEYCESAVH